MLKPPRIGMFVDLPLLGHPKPTFRDVVQLVKQINRDAGLVVFGKLNLLLAVAAIKEDLEADTDARWKAQGLMIRTTISQRRLNELQYKLGNAHLRDVVIFHRPQMLATIKLVALFGDSSRGNRLQSRSDHEAIAELALAVNSLFDFRPIPEGLLGARQLAAQLAPSHELENIPRIDHALARTMRMLGPLLERHFEQPGATELERLFVFLTNGFSFQAYQDMVFGLFAYWQSLSIDDLGAFQSRAFLNPYGANSLVTGQLFEQFLMNLDVDASDLPGGFGHIPDNESLLLDHTAFRARPVWRFSPERYLCVDPSFVVEKLASGFYWSVNQALDSEQRTYDFSSLWGLLFEDYVHEMLQHAVPPESGRLFESPFYDAPREEAFDALVLEGADAIVIEIKGLFARTKEKYCGRFVPFFECISSKFGNQPGAAVQQLASPDYS